MTQVRTGDRIKNNDPRYAGQIVDVKGVHFDEVGGWRANYYTVKGRRVSISFDRIMLPGEKGNTRNKWTLLQRGGLDVT
jgi:hypothetical protein